MIRTCLLASLPLALVLGCPPWPEFVTCEEADACGTSGSTSFGDGGSPTTSDGVHTATGDDADPNASSSTAPAGESGDESGSTADEPVLPPQIVNGVVIPDYIDDNGLLDVEVTTNEHTEGVRMLLDNGDLIELTPVRPGQFVGQIFAFSGLDNGKHTAVLTPWREMIEGESVDADYVIALPSPGVETHWEADGINGSVAAIAVLPDGRPVEFGTYEEMGAPRCYLRLRTKKGEQEKPMDFVPLLASAYCRAIDLKIDRDTGRLHVLVERKSNDELVWWAGEMSVWGKGLKNIGIGAVGDTALALAARPDVVAVCGTRVAAKDKLDALAVLLRPGEPPEARVFDYWPANKPNLAGTFTETARDCAFAGDTLVLVGEAWGKHDGEFGEKRDRLMVIESDLAAAADPAWTVAGLDQGVQTRALALDLDDQGRYVLAGYTCFDACEPVGEVRVYAPGGKLVAPTASLGPLGSAWFGPHDIAWSPAGYAVVALGELQGQTFVFKVQAVAPGAALPLWTFLPSKQQGLQLALAVAVGPYGEVYAGGIGAADHPAFARIGS
ncbi:MAG: hypothetical protein H0T76_10185 [Nannocystis sp.]|nr:hypothetical protein [Nannocystis sp.]MBA3546840.1 hypothetical protein [Nannocystis sp.]